MQFLAVVAAVRNFSRVGGSWPGADLSRRVCRLVLTASFVIAAAPGVASANIGIATVGPLNGSTVSGEVRWIVNAVSPDGTGVKRVEFSIDGRDVWTEYLPPYSFGGDSGLWDTTTVADGWHALRATAVSKDDEEASQVVTVMVRNGRIAPSSAPAPPPAPSPSPSTPAPSPSLSTPTSALTALALDHARIQLSWPAVTGAATARVYRDGRLVATRLAALRRYTDSMLWFSTTYEYSVRLHASSGALVAAFGPLRATTKPLPARGFPVAFGSSPVWTVPIAANPTLSPRSAAFVQYLNEHARNPNLTTRSYGVPVYQAESGDPLFGPFTCQYACDVDSGARVPIPDYAVPDPGTDLHMTVISPDGRTAWDFYRPRKNASGAWVSTSAGATLDLAGSGVVPKSTAGADAANFGLLAGLVRPEELAQGHIDHALVIGVPGIAGGPPACPATHNVGTTTDSDAMPAGARLQLDPAVDVSALDLPAWQKTIARAMQRYGAYVRDNSGTLAVYGETTGTDVGGRRYDGWSKAGLGFDASGGSQPFSSAFPWNRMRVLAFMYGPDC